MVISLMILRSVSRILQLRREGVLLLRGLDSRLSKDLPSDLQKLRCKVSKVFSSCCNSLFSRD